MYASSATYRLSAQLALLGGFSPVTLTGTYTMTAKSPTFLRLDPGGSTRIVKLPSTSKSYGPFFIENTADAAESLTVKDSAGTTTVATLTRGQAAWFGWDSAGEAWVCFGQTLGAAAGPVDLGSGPLSADTIQGSTQTTGTFKVAVADNQANAFEIAEGSNSYLRAVTTNGSEALLASKPVVMAGGASFTGTEKRTTGGLTAAAGTTSADAGVLGSGHSVQVATGADDTKGVRIAAADAVDGMMIFIANNVANKILKVYPPTGGEFNGGSVDAAFSSDSGKGVVAYCYNAASGFWMAW